MKLRPATTSRSWRKGTLPLRAAVLQILDGFDGSMSTRQVFYQCVSVGAIANTDRSYDKVQRLLVNMRRAGEIPYGRIVDRARRRHRAGQWDGVADILDAVSVQYRRDIWTTQKTVAMVACEKQALEGIFAAEVDIYGASLWTIKGFISEGFLYEFAEEIREHNAAGQGVIVSYFGDHDPSGLSISEKLRDGLTRLGAKGFSFSREGLLFDDITAYEIPNVPVKRTDTRAKKYLAEFGDVGAELDALPPAVLRQRIRDCIKHCISAPDEWERLQQAEQIERADLALVASNWNAALSAAKGAA